MKKKKVTRKIGATKKKRDTQRPSRDVPPPSASETTLKPAPFSYQELREISIQISASWFRPPESTHLTLMEVHPWRLHAYWNITDADLAAAREHVPTSTEEPRLVLRFTDISTQSGTAPVNRFYIEVQGLRNNWYVDLWQDGRRYTAQLGLRTVEGDIIPLAHANDVELPRATPSSELEFKQLAVRTPLPLDLAIPKTSVDHGEYLLQHLLPRRRAPNEAFPAFTPTTAKIPPELPEFSTSTREYSVRGNSPASHELEQPDLGTARTSPPRERPLATEFPAISENEIAAYSVRAKKEKARLLAGVKTKLPPVPKETIAPAEITLTPQTLRTLTHESELRDNVFAKESPRESSLRPVDLTTSRARAPNTGATLELFQGNLPKITPDKDTKFSEHQRPVPPGETGAWQGRRRPLEPQGDVSTANTPHAERSKATQSAPDKTREHSGPAPRPAVALEEVLSNALFSYGRGDTALEVTAELQLQGKLEPGSVLSLLGERVHVDAQGNFSLRLKLDRGPALATLLYDRHYRTEDNH